MSPYLFPSIPPDRFWVNVLKYATTVSFHAETETALYEIVREFNPHYQNHLGLKKVGKQTHKTIRRVILIVTYYKAMGRRTQWPTAPI